MRDREGETFAHAVTKRLTGCVCPQCCKKVEGGTSLDFEPGERVPKAGDWSVCAYCGSLNKYVEAAEPLCGVKLRPATEEERAELERDPDMKLLVDIATKAVEAYKRMMQ